MPQNKPSQVLHRPILNLASKQIPGCEQEFFGKTAGSAGPLRTLNAFEIQQGSRDDQKHFGRSSSGNGAAAKGYRTQRAIF